MIVLSQSYCTFMDSTPNTESTIESESQYELALRTLSKRSRPPKLLRLLMAALESYRQSRRMGWSRKQNKYGVTTFASFKLGARVAEFAPEILRICDSSFAALSTERRAFIEQLVADPSLMGFMFFQETSSKPADEMELFESVTLSIGRVVPNARRFRDRVDLILDAPIENGEAGSLSQVRLFVDPFFEHAPSVLVNTDVSVAARTLLCQVSDFYRAHRDDDALAWDHWTQDYIDYFGPRQRAVKKTRFPTPLDDAYERSILESTAPTHAPADQAGAA